MVDRRDVASWLEGPRARTQAPGEYPGQALGMPPSGHGSIARFGRRLVAITIDWLLCQLIAFLVLRAELGQAGAASFAPLAVFAVENLLLLPTMGATVGQRLLGIMIMAVDRRRVSVIQATMRTLLLCLAIPALIWDRDGRGLHDKAAATVLVRR